ncbi:MAG TPA: acyl-CoA dehydrogenase family protein [Dehalococcoidia bacterium]|nr:acyl-CoA dehydrogenase family protein [Dehalococcoidia bacterium]
MTNTSLPYETLEEAVEIARGLAPKLRERVGQADEQRRLPEENVRDLLDSGLIALEVPKRFGGGELNLDALIEVTGAIAEGCPATGWVYSLWAAHMWLIGQYPEPIQAMVFEDRNSLVSSVVNTVGTPVAVEGGFLWTGRGFFSSGVDHCNWLTAAVDLKPEEPPGDRRWFLLKREDFEIVDDWNTVGLRGTGSKTIEFEDVFIPEERAVLQKDLSEGKGQGATMYGSPLYCAAMDFTFSLPIAAPVVGVARAAVRELEARIRKRLESTNYRIAAEQTGTLLRIAEASAQIDAARALLLESARRFCVIPAAEATALDKAECRRNVAYASQLCRHAANSVFEAAGASNLYEGSDLQRLWRDSNVAAMHHGSMWDVHGLAYGREVVGLPPAWMSGIRSSEA